MSDEMEKYSVVTEEKELLKTASGVRLCPECGSKVESHGNVVRCPKCGTRPFEVSHEEGRKDS